ncbi:MAG: hypothetical protein ABI445_24265 [Polyangia bacterium]
MSADEVTVRVPLLDLVMQREREKLEKMGATEPTEREKFVERRLQQRFEDVFTLLGKQERIARLLADDQAAMRGQARKEDLRVTQLETNVRELREQLAELRNDFAAIDEFTARLQRLEDR